MRYLLRCLGFSLVVFLQACGGGGADGGANLQAPQSATAPVITGFSPATALIGDTVQVNGRNFAGVSTVTLGASSLAFTHRSDSLIEFVVPAAAVSAPISVSGAAGSAQSSATLLIVADPVIASAAVSRVSAGASFGVSGSQLDKAQDFLLIDAAGNVTVLGVVSRGSGSATLTAPAAVVSGTLGMRLASGRIIRGTVPLDVLGAPQVSGFAPAAAIAGAVITIQGSNLQLVSSVNFGAAVAVPTVVGATSLSVAVPVNAGNGPLRLNYPGGSVSSSASFGYIASAVVAAVGTELAADGSATITITGQSLDLITAVRVGGVVASIASRTSTLLVAKVGAAASGDIVIDTTAVAGQKVGTLVRGSAAPLTIARLEFAQHFAREDSDPALRLVPNRPTLLRLTLLAARAGVTAPVVKVTAIAADGTALGTMDMVGPGQVPLAVDAYSASDAWLAALPSPWMLAGTRYRVDVAPAQAPMLIRTATPTFGADSRLKLMLVPMKVGSFLPTVPSAAQVQDAIYRAYPYARANIQIETHATLDASDITSVASADWDTLLDRVTALRVSESGAAQKAYMGVIPSAVRTDNVAGLGYVGSLAAASAGNALMAAVTYDSPATATTSDPFGVSIPAWSRTLIHELGHNMSRLHAPCGSIKSADTLYPYADGRFGPRAVYDVRTGVFSAPTQGAGSATLMPDVMGYCSGAFFSDYNLDVVQRFAEAWTSGARLLSAPMEDPLRAASQDRLLVSGRITDRGVVFQPLAITRAELSAGGSSYTLRVRTAEGQTLEREVATFELADHLPTHSVYFQTTLPLLEGIAAIELHQGGRPLARAAQRERLQTAAPGAPAVQIERGGEGWQLRWDAANWPALTVVQHGRDGQRRVLAQGLNSGRVSLHAADLEPGARLEAWLADERGVRRLPLSL